MHLRSNVQRFFAAFLLTTLLAAACSGSATTTLTESAALEADPPQTADSTEATSAVEPTAVPAAPSEPTPEPVVPTAAPEPTATPEVVFFGSELQVGDCFNRRDGNPSFQPPEIVSCSDLHHEELYAKDLLPDPAGAPYPGQDELADRVSTELCDPAAIDFLGATWDLVPVATLLLFPVEEEWDAGDRYIMCAAASSEEGTAKIGTAAGGTIDSDEVVLTRAGISSGGVDFDDWTVITEHASLDKVGSLSDGQFDLPLRPPFHVGQGFIFNAKAAGDEGHATTTWGYSWLTQEFTDLGSILPGYELASTIVTRDGTTIFAARATAADDFDLWSTASGDAEILIGGDGDQQFPALSPDQTTLVYQDRDDIWVANIDGSDPRQLTSGPATEWESIVSPDGRTVVFSSDRSGNDDLWAVDIDGGEPVNLTNHPADEIWPAFSEDGTRIYFASDRLVPTDDRLVVMVMNPDGSNQSWFGNAQSSQPTIIPQAIADLVVATTPTLDERYTYELLDGEPGATAEWAHSNGRLVVDLPTGWRVAELDNANGFIAAPRPSQYYATWDADGILVTLWDDQSQDDFFTMVSETEVQSCDQFDGTDGIVPIGDGVVGLSANFNCSDDGAVGGVIGFYNQETGVGLIIEGQRDNQPNADLDTEILTAIARSLAWE